MTPHVVLELRTSRQAEHTPETAAQLFATLPQLKDQPWHKLLKKDEHLSFEVLVQNQTVYFLCYVPHRLMEYVASLLQSSYPEILITWLDFDPVTLFFPEKTDEQLGVQNHQLSQSRFVDGGILKLKQAEYFPLKSYQDFSEIDPLAPLLSSLAKSGPYDQILLQFVIAHSGDNWKRAGFNKLGQKNSPVEVEGMQIVSASPQQALIKKKMQGRAHLVSIRCLVASDSQERSRLLLEQVTSALQSIAQSEGNGFTLSRPFLTKKALQAALLNRTFSFFSTYHLTLEELAALYHLPNKKLSHIPNIAWGKQLLGEPPENLPVITRETPEDQKRDINPFAKTEFKNIQSVYGLKRYDRRKHMYVIGKTGTGKSTMLANMAINDLKNNEGLCVIDPHGDLVETLLNYIPSRRINDVVYFDPGDVERTVQINLFEGENVVHRELIASGIVSIFHKLYSYSWGPRLEYILRNALLTLLTAPQSRMSDIVDLLTNKSFRDSIVDQLEDDILRNFWVYEFDKMPDRQRTDAIAPILNKVGQFVSSPLVRNVVNAHKSSFNIEEIMDQGKILLVNLSQGKLGEDNATLLGAMLITKIQLAALARVNQEEAARQDFYLYVDEFQNFATESFIKILSEARKYRLNLTLANQYIAQIPEEVQKAIFGNCGSIASFIMGADDAGVFAKEYGDLYTQEDLVSLGRFQIINKISIDNITSKPFPAHTLPLAKSSNNNREKVIKVSRERYAKKKTKTKSRRSKTTSKDKPQSEKKTVQNKPASQATQSNKHKNSSKKASATDTELESQPKQTQIKPD